jgi:hypothetical protein
MLNALKVGAAIVRNERVSETSIYVESLDSLMTSSPLYLIRSALHPDHHQVYHSVGVNSTLTLQCD